MHKLSPGIDTGTQNTISGANEKGFSLTDQKTKSNRRKN